MILTSAGIIALVAVVGFFVFVGEFTPWMYQRGGFLVLALVVALLIAMATHPASPLGPWLGSQPWRYVGQRSYGLYLWHWPIFMVTRPTLDVPFDGIPLLVGRLALTFVVAEASFRFVEMPIRRGAIGRWIRGWRASSGRDRRHRTGRAVTAMGAGVAGLALVGAVLATAPAPTAAADLPDDVAEAMGVADGGPTEVTLGEEVVVASAAPTSAAAPTVAANDNGTMSGIGDSVMLGARSTVKDVIKGSRIDAAVSRFPGAFIGKLKRYVARDGLAPVVVLHPGTNGVLPADMMREMLDILEDTPVVVVVNDNMPRRWRAPNNKVIDAVVPDYDNAVVADWYGASKDHPEYFASDGIHLTPVGARAYAHLIKKSAGL